MEDTRTYEFRVNCRLSVDPFNTTDAPLALSLPTTELSVSIFLPPRDALGEKWMHLTCGGFASEALARAAGLPVKRAALLAGLQMGTGIDAGNDEVLSGAARKGGEPDDRLQPFVHGLQVSPEVEGRIFGFLRLVGHEPRDFRGSFEKAFKDGYAPERSLTPQQVVAAQLYSHSHFHSSDAPRVITLVSAVEALASRSPMSTAAVGHLGRLIEATRAADLGMAEKDALLNGLGNLKRESIGSACRTLVGRHCSEPDVERFRLAYEVRSSLLHDGEAPGADLGAAVRELDSIVRLVVVGEIATSWRASAPQGAST